MSIKRKHQIQKLSSRPFSQFGAEMPATVTRNSLSAPERITSAATPWQTSPCVELQTGAHCLSWVLSELCLKFHILTLFVFIFKNYHMSCMLLTEGCAELVLPQSYRSHWTFICMCFFFFWGVKMYHCLLKHFWWPYHCYFYAVTLFWSSLKGMKFFSPF